MRGRQPGFPRLLSNQEPINEPESPRGQVDEGKDYRAQSGSGARRQ